MDVFYKIISLLGGLAMFLYGMRVMGDGLKQNSGGTLKSILAKVASRPALGFLLGMFITCLIQSSTATIVLTVGLVGAGFLTFRQSIGIVLGANVGTAITAQVIRLMDLNAGAGSILYLFKADNLAPLALLIGIILLMFTRRGSYKNFGSIACGLGVLFMGLIFMSQSVSEMREPLGRILTTFQDNYLLGFLSGVGVTGIIQSSSAVVGILQSIASSIGVEFCGVFAIIIGVNIGDCLTTFLVCRVGANPAQVRTTVVHIIYNIFAALLIIAVLFIGRSTGLLSDEFWTQTLDSGGVANVHGLFRLVPAVLLLPLTSVFARIAEKIVPDKPKYIDDEDRESAEKMQEFLAPHLIQSPALALSQVSEMIAHIGDVAIHNYTSAVVQVFDFDEKRAERIAQREESVDRMTDATHQYVVQLSPHITRDRDTRNQSFQIKALTCFERIGDMALNIVENAENLQNIKKDFSDSAKAELRVVFDAVEEILVLALNAYRTRDPRLARKVEPLEEVIDDLVRDVQSRHIDRMTHNQCDVFGGIQFQNILQNLERISDQCSSMAVYILEQTDTTIIGQEHQYVYDLHHSDNAEYTASFRANYEKYYGLLRQIPAVPEQEDGAVQ